MKSRRLPLEGSSRSRSSTASEKTTTTGGDEANGGSKGAKRRAAPSERSGKGSNRSLVSTRSLPVRQSQRESTASAATDDSKTPKPSPEANTRTQEATTGSSRPRRNSVDSGIKPERSTRKRMITQDSPPLVAVTDEGSSATVTVMVDGHPYVPPANSNNSSKDSVTLGNDGNQFYCHVCRGFGNVVCCDGCPRVYHQACIPEEDPSRIALENDEDPWFCPACPKGKTATRTSRRSEKGDRRSSGHKCTDCGDDRADLALEPCSECGNYVHHPACVGDVLRGDVAICSTCLAVDELTHQEDEINESKAESLKETQPTEESVEHEAPQAQDDAEMEELEMDTNDGPDDDPENENSTDDKDQTKKKRKRSGDLKLKKKKKKKRRNSLAESVDGSSQSFMPSEEAQLSPRKNIPGVAQAIPAFYFYLAENRWKIERVLARKHRYFNRLPKGTERNEIVAKEAALWWVKLRPTDHRRYMTMSMRDYENRIILWKEEKSAREMMLVPEDGDVDTEVIVDAPDISADDERRTYERHQRLYMSTSVGSKPFKPEPDQSYNRVLLDLLHDMRFHPLPMFCVNRPDHDKVIDDHSSKVTIPHFEVHGPIATSIGDECLGCSRGWTHFCPVVQRRLPAVDHRARLQPPLSSLMATRVGVGLRPRLEREVVRGEEDSNAPRAVGKDLFVWKETGEMKEIRELPILPSCSVTEPSERYDDIVQFIEETTAMKVPEPPRPSLPDTGNTKSNANARSLPTQRLKDEIAGEGDGVSGAFNKCGRCRTIIENDTGCVQCRRAQLVINMSKRQPSAPSNGSGKQGKEGKMLKVHTAMLGRVQMKEGNGATQSRGDAAVSSALLRERWSPSAILAPRVADTPSSGREEQVFMGRQEDMGEAAAKESYQNPQDDEMLIDEPQVTDPLPRDPTSEDRSTRLRSTRTKDMEGVDRQEVARKHKKDVDEVNKKVISIACYGILLALLRRDPLKLFAQPVAVEGYLTIVKTPIDLGKIRSDVLEEKYKTLGAFMSDARLLCQNALMYNPPSSIYWKTAKEISGVLDAMQKRAVEWMNAIKNAHKSFLARKESRASSSTVSTDDVEDDDATDGSSDDVFEELRKTWPEAVEILENGVSLRRAIESDFMRTKENEAAYYGSIAVRRAAAAAEASLAPYNDSSGVHAVVSKRSHRDDETLRELVDEKVTERSEPVQLRDVSTWREEAVVRLMRKVQSRRLERRTFSESGCSRCVVIDNDIKTATNAESTLHIKSRKKTDVNHGHVEASRVFLTTGLGSAKTCQKIVKREEQTSESKLDSVNDVCVSVRGSRIHGMGLFADQPFKQGDAVAEYIGEYIGNQVADSREKVYREQRIQDYQFRLDDKLVIDATMKGGHGRYINHNCVPNCFAKIMPGEAPNEHLRRVMIVAMRTIDINEEITYDYQFPLELDLTARVPCNCQADACRGFMNWDLPEKGSNNRALLVQKRGANMRDRIRRLGRPLKRDES